MDDDDDRLYSRAPEIEDIVRVCRALNEIGARYVLIGGFAVILHGYVRGTKDVDLLIDASDENVRKVKAALAILPDRAADDVEDGDVRRFTVVRVADEIVVDLMARACGIDFEEASREIEIVDVEGVPIPVASKRLLIRTKRTVRPHDAADVAFLEARLAEDD